MSPNPLEISVLEVERISYKMPTWELLEIALRSALQAGSVNADEITVIIKNIHGHLKATLNPALGKGEASYIIHQFKNLLANAGPVKKKRPKQMGKVLSSLCFHTEALMTAFSLYPDKIREWHGHDAEWAQVQSICKVRGHLFYCNCLRIF